MKRYLILVLFLFCFQLQAQDDLSLNLTPLEASAVNWELSLDIRLSAASGPDLLIEFPAGVQLVPTVIGMNGESYWLQNSTDAPERESVVHWFADTSGICLRFLPADIAAGTEIRLTGVLSLIKKEVQITEQVRLKTVSSITDESVTAETVIATTTVPIVLSK